MPRFGKKYYFLPIFFAGWSLACDLHTQHFLLIWIVFSQMSISSIFNQVAKWVPSYSFTYSCISQEWRSGNQFEQSANEIGHHIASLTPSPPKWMRFFPLQQCCKSVESVENTFFLFFVVWNCKTNFTVLSCQCISSLCFFSLVSSAPVRVVHWKREQRMKQRRTLLLINQCYNLMKFVCILTEFQFFICFIPKRQAEVGLSTECCIISV